MLVHAFLIKYAEIALKGKNRYRFEDALVHQMEIALSKIEGDFEVKKEQGRVYVFCPENYDYDEAVDALQHVFGIVGICPVMIYEEQGFEKLAEDVVSYMKQWHPDFNGTFKVWTRRAKKSYPISSMEVSAELGGRILDAFPEASVDVHHPELDLSVEIRDKIYVYSQTIPGAGGMPIGTNGKAMLLLSGGIDSPVAAYCMARRGLALHHIHFASPPYTSLRAKLKVRALARELAEYTGNCQLFVVPYTKPQEYIRDNAPDVLFTVLMRRSMLRIAKLVADQSEMEALITGESLAQVASQTMQAIACTDAAQNLPILRPLIGMDKTEIIAISRKIGTFDTSIEPYEDCCTIFTPPHPKTKPSLAEIEAAEAGMPGLAELERIAAETVEKIPIRIGDDPEF